MMLRAEPRSARTWPSEVMGAQWELFTAASSLSSPPPPFTVTVLVTLRDQRQPKWTERRSLNKVWLIHTIQDAVSRNSGIQLLRRLSYTCVERQAVCLRSLWNERHSKLLSLGAYRALFSDHCTNVLVSSAPQHTLICVLTLLAMGGSLPDSSKSCPPVKQRGTFSKYLLLYGDWRATHVQRMVRGGGSSPLLPGMIPRVWGSSEAFFLHQLKPGWELYSLLISSLASPLESLLLLLPLFFMCVMDACMLTYLHTQFVNHTYVCKHTHVYTFQGQRRRSVSLIILCLVLSRQMGTVAKVHWKMWT